MLVRTSPFVFALLWSTGFIGAKYGLPYIEPFTFLAVRMLLTMVVIGIIIMIVRPPFPSEKQCYVELMVSGVLIHVLYLGGVFMRLN